ncbi:MAG: hypothetical protein ACHQEB_06280 [Chitinophagales bacterium]
MIDKNEYDESQLIEIRVALNMPYQERFTDFERLYGEIEIDGKSYTYVKRKIDGDVVVFKCIANQSKQELKAIKNEWTKTSAGIETDHPGKQEQQSSFAKNFWSEYNGQNDLNGLNEHTFLNKAGLSRYLFHIPEVSTNTPHQPPEC